MAGIRLGLIASIGLARLGRRHCDERGPGVRDRRRPRRQRHLRIRSCRLWVPVRNYH